MPASLVLHVADALALGGLHHDGEGYTLGLLGLGKGGLHLVKVVTVDLSHFKTECLQLLRNGIGAHHVGDVAVDLQAVVVDDDAQVVQLVVVGQHKGLPNLALLDLAVTQQGVYPAVLALVLGGQSHAGGSGDTLAQRAGGHVHAGGLVHVGVSLEAAADVAQGLQLLPGEEALQGQGGVQAGGGVSLGKDEAVPLLPLGVGGLFVPSIDSK